MFLVMSLGHAQEAKEKSETKVLVTKTARTLGRSSSWLSTVTAKPFLIVAGFFVGVTERKDKNADSAALYQFFLNHVKEFDQIYLEVGTSEEMDELILITIDNILEKKAHTIHSDYLAHLGLPIDTAKVNPDFINNHPEYAEIKGIVGEVKKGQLEEIIKFGYFDNFSIENFAIALNRIHEKSSMVLGISGSCVNKNNQKKFESDKELKEFCSYVINSSNQQLLISKAKGYTGGKKLRAQIEQKLKASKERRKNKKK
jgi:hypothetical protein